VRARRVLALGGLAALAALAAAVAPAVAAEPAAAASPAATDGLIAAEPAARMATRPDGDPGGDGSSRAEPARRAAHGESVSLSVLTYNTHGLPGWLAGDDPPARYPLLLEKAARFDVVLLQEDFAHQPIVDAEKHHPLLVRGNGAWRDWPLFQGAGLTLLAHLAALASPVLAPYELCHGWLSAANDCLGHKGFLMQRLRLAGGAAIDVWNTHLDAGSGAGDQAARAAQLERLAEAIARHSHGRAVIAGGDFNLDWDEPHERALLERFLARAGLAIAALAPAGAWRSRLDYLLYRPAPGAALAVRESGMAHDFVAPGGAPLSDHPAIFAVFEVPYSSEASGSPSQ
jgi:endonuclease/exonuclease/phosphatase family metal-dependent hydrolase